MSPGPQFWKRFYNLVAPLYDPILGLGNRLGVGGEKRVRSKLIATLDLPGTARILEVGAGTATNQTYLPPHSSYFGLDLSFRMLHHGRRKLQGDQSSVSLVNANGQRLPLPSTSFDLVLAMGVLQHLGDPAVAMAEMERVARPGATLLLIDEHSSLRRVLSLPIWHSPQPHHLQNLFRHLGSSVLSLKSSGFCADYYWLHLTC